MENKTKSKKEMKMQKNQKRKQIHLSGERNIKNTHKGKTYITPVQSQHPY